MGRLWLLVVSGCTGFVSTHTQPRPRLVAPLSTATVSTARPTLRFSLPPPLVQPQVELCARRACDGALLPATVDSSGTSATPDSDLAPGLWYWRVRSGSTVSAVWQLYVQPTGGAETSWGSRLDLNGDGFDELAIGAPDSIILDTNQNAGRVYFYSGSRDGPDPAQPLILDGPDGGGQFGQSLASVDFDGDGFADLAVGAPTRVISDQLQGSIYVYRGGPNGLERPAAFVLTGSGFVTEGLGWSLDCAGDFNGDGYGDLVAGAPTTLIADQVRSGEAFIFFGGPAEQQATMPLNPEQNLNESIGLAVAGGGDIDGDGLSDVIVGAPAAETSTGRAFAYYITGSAHRLQASPPPLARFGIAMAQLGDLDGDGRVDFAVSAINEGSGRVYRYSGATDPVLTGILDAPDPGKSDFGSTLAAADYDGDGKNDLVVAATCAPGDNQACPGAVFLLLGGTLTRVAAPAGITQYGVALSTGDLDGDGHPDLTVGASETNQQLGRVDWYRNGNGAPRIFNGVDVGGRFGFAVR
jgi:hypothetical protein